MKSSDIETICAANRMGQNPIGFDATSSEVILCKISSIYVVVELLKGIIIDKEFIFTS